MSLFSRIGSAGKNDYYVRKCKARKDRSLTKRHSNESQKSAKCASVNEKTRSWSICVVPIWFGHKDWTKMFKTYAMLDNWSQGLFTKDELIKDLGITRKKL